MFFMQHYMVKANVDTFGVFFYVHIVFFVHFTPKSVCFSLKALKLKNSEIYFQNFMFHHVLNVYKEKKKLVLRF
jgi:hypothetical protein